MTLRARRMVQPLPEALIVVLAKAPLPGRVKTRLVPALGAGGAARLHRVLVDRTVSVAVAARVGAVELHGTPSVYHSFFAACRRMHGVRLHAQRGDDLGARMAHALRAALGRARCVVLVGTDCPELVAQDLQAAVQVLRGGADAVLGPAEDGGYWLIGLRRPNGGVFQGIPWGARGVLSATRRALRVRGLAWSELAVRWDVDRPSDLRRLRRVAPGLLPA